VDFKVLYTQAALADLEAVMEWSWDRHKATSERFAKSLLNHVDLLKTFPYLGTPTKGFPGVRRLLHSPIHVYYCIDEKRKIIEVLHFWHAVRQGPKI
jgi:plasmid stabilization system protein ParE